tara:strand:+ start:417 stop:566 length:150 start_codon:yes stop_codon:yes gene_type:complete
MDSYRVRFSRGGMENYTGSMTRDVAEEQMILLLSEGHWAVVESVFVCVL